MKTIWRNFKALLLVALGAVLAVGLGQCGNNTFPSHWFKIEQPSRVVDTPSGGKLWGGQSVWSAEIMEKAESLKAALPQAEKLTGRVKFVTSGQRGNDYSAPLGYELELLLQSREGMQRDSEAVKVKNLETSWQAEVYPQNVNVEVRFILRDKDGFHLATLKGQPDFYDSFGTVQPGKPSTLKGLTAEKVSHADASATKTIECEILFEDMSVSAEEFLNAQGIE